MKVDTGQIWLVVLPGRHELLEAEVLEVTPKTVLLEVAIPSDMYNSSYDMITNRYATVDVRFIEEVT